MYDFYPEWGPAQHRPADEQPIQRRPRYWGTRTPAGTTGARDADIDRPDDN